MRLTMGGLRGADAILELPPGEVQVCAVAIWFR